MLQVIDNATLVKREKESVFVGNFAISFNSPGTNK